MGRILVVDDKEGIRTFIAEVLRNAGHDVETAKDGADAIDLLETRHFHLMISDLKMPKVDGLALLEAAQRIAPEMAAIVLTAHGTVDTAVTAMKMGAFDYLTKPLSGPDEIRLIVTRALAHRRIHIEQVATQSAKAQMVAADPAMLAIVSLIDKVAVTDATVLLLGESGAGKEVAAREIHRRSRRNNAPFVPVNCAAISETLVESEMFGHEKGAFTGATDQRLGRFEQADSGTLFLDEVGELPLPLQAKLLRVLQEKAFERVGGDRTITVDVRIVAATNRQLEAEIRAGRFREDLFHRISVFPIQLPPLRERTMDIPLLTDHLLGEIATRINRPALTISNQARERLLGHSWPGNVRELSNILERAAIISDEDRIDVHHLMLDSGAAASSPFSSQPTSPGASSPTSLRDIEREAIKQALEENDGHRKKAAERLGIGLRTLYNKLKLYGLE